MPNQLAAPFCVINHVSELSYAASGPSWIGSTIEGSSFSGLLTRVEIGHIRIRPAGKGRIRVGADYGEAQFRSIVVPPTGFSTPEVASDALNRAVKIQESCVPGQFRIGRAVYELVHVKWLERATEVAFDGESVGIPG